MIEQAESSLRSFDYWGQNIDREGERTMADQDSGEKSSSIGDSGSGLTEEERCQLLEDIIISLLNAENLDRVIKFIHERGPPTETTKNEISQINLEKFKNSTCKELKRSVNELLGPADPYVSELLGSRP